MFLAGRQAGVTISITALIEFYCHLLPTTTTTLLRIPPRDNARRINRPIPVLIFREGDFNPAGAAAKSQRFDGGDLLPDAGNQLRKTRRATADRAESEGFFSERRN